MSTEPEAQIDRMAQEIDRLNRVSTQQRVALAWIRDNAIERTIIETAEAALDPGPAARGETPLLDVE